MVPNGKWLGTLPSFYFLNVVFYEHVTRTYIIRKAHCHGHKIISGMGTWPSQANESFSRITGTKTDSLCGWTWAWGDAISIAVGIHLATLCQDPIQEWYSSQGSRGQKQRNQVSVTLSEPLCQAPGQSYCCPHISHIFLFYTFAYAVPFTRNDLLPHIQMSSGPSEMPLSPSNFPLSLSFFLCLSWSDCLLSQVLNIIGAS